MDLSEFHEFFAPERRYIRLDLIAKDRSYQKLDEKVDEFKKVWAIAGKCKLHSTYSRQDMMSVRAAIRNSVHSSVQGLYSESSSSVQHPKSEHARTSQQDWKNERGINTMQHGGVQHYAAESVSWYSTAPNQYDLVTSAEVAAGKCPVKGCVRPADHDGACTSCDGSSMSASAANDDSPVWNGGGRWRQQPADEAGKIWWDTANEAHSPGRTATTYYNAAQSPSRSATTYSNGSLDDSMETDLLREREAMETDLQWHTKVMASLREAEQAKRQDSGGCSSSQPSRAEANTGESDPKKWTCYDSGESGLWWHRESDNKWFMESNPGPWKKFLDPKSQNPYWWNEETSDWFMIS